MTETTLRTHVTIRDAGPDDAEAICRIYNQGIEDRVATLETELRTPAERREWMAAHGPRHPVLIAQTEPLTVANRPPAAQAGLAVPATIAWASLNRFNPRPVYDHVADVSVYIERAWRGRGVGRALLAALIERARTLGYHKTVLAAFPDNGAGMALYTRLGFTRVGVYREQGRLDGRWVDVVVMERLL
ncbi:MAG: GNAT family N-acetyltransferase [Candidatus Rokuibacteriota bacterium]|nr:MAG: GNAT family N-acetyltransferase [Candidatus Rokubacteria bacterium]